MATKRVAVMNTAFRDGFQSVFGARVFTKDFLPALEAAKAAGFTHFEAGGGAGFQALYLYCRESAFDMMDAFRATVGPDANLQTLSRGVNVVGLESQSSDVIKLHADMFVKHGMTTIRNFDALNDVRNLAYSGRCIAEAGLKHEVVVTMMGLPPGVTGAHTAEFYLGVLRDILDDGVPYHSVCFKDASGTTPPRIVHDTIKAARKLLGDDVHLRVHTHETAGQSVAQNLAALDAGADGIDVSLAPVSGGTAQPDAVVMWQALRGSDYDLGLDIRKLLEAEAVLKDCLRDYFIPPEALAVEPLIPFSPMPGGALTANTAMMRDNGILERYPAVIAKMNEVVARGGMGTSVTPVSQFYFQQSFNNEMFGDWKRVADGYGKMVLGYFGKTPQPPDPEIVKLASEQLGLEPTTRNPREINDEDPTKGVDVARATLKAEGFPETDENLFIIAALRDKGVAFLKGEGQLGVRKIDKRAPQAKAAGSSASDAWDVTVDGRAYSVVFGTDGAATVDGRTYQYTVGAASNGQGAGAAEASSSGVEIRSELAAKVFKLVAQQGASVAEGDTILILEALKMEIPVPAPRSGTLATLAVGVGDAVPAGGLLATIR